MYVQSFIQEDLPIDVSSLILLRNIFQHYIDKSFFLKTILNEII